MTLKDSIDLYNRVAEMDSYHLSDEDLEAMRRSIADPTGLRPLLEQQVEQNDQHTEQIEQINTTLQQHRQAANEERRLREKADAEEHQFTLKWNRINLAVAIAGVLLALIALFK